VDCLLSYGVPRKRKAFRKASEWLLAQDKTEYAVWEGLFIEPQPAAKPGEPTLGRTERYAKFQRHVTAKPCCARTPIPATCCVLETLFALGEDVSTHARLAGAVDRILAFGNTCNGICGGSFSKLDAQAITRSTGRTLWGRADNTIFRHPREMNPGVTVCTLFLLRAVARSEELSSSQLVQAALQDWRAHQLENGNFDTSYGNYDFFYALETLGLFERHPIAREMVVRMLPAILRRQKRDGRWWSKDDWLSPTFTVIWTLRTFGLLG